MIATILIVFMMILRVGIHLAKHGEKMDRKFNFPGQLLSHVVDMLILYAAGLFDKFI